MYNKHGGSQGRLLKGSNSSVTEGDHWVEGRPEKGELSWDSRCVKWPQLSAGKPCVPSFRARTLLVDNEDSPKDLKKRRNIACLRTL